MSEPGRNRRECILTRNSPKFIIDYGSVVDNVYISRWFCIHPSRLSLCFALFADADGWLLLDIGQFVLFLNINRERCISAKLERDQQSLLSIRISGITKLPHLYLNIAGKFPHDELSISD